LKNKKICANCEHWLKHPLFDDNQKDNLVKKLASRMKPAGFCKRFPPRYFASSHGIDGYEQRCPETEFDEYCGEFVERKK